MAFLIKVWYNINIYHYIWRIYTMAIKMRILHASGKKKIVNIANAIKEKAGVGTAAHGLCFFLPVEMSTLTIHEQELIE